MTDVVHPQQYGTLIKDARAQTLLSRLRRPHGLGAQLDRLAPEHVVLHDVPGLEHLVVGPSGVFALTGRVQRGKRIWVGSDTLTVHGDRQPYVQVARQAASRASRLLSAANGQQVRVQAVLAVECESLFITTQPGDVRVLAVTEARRWVASQAFALHPRQVELIAGAARLMTTWA